MIGSLRHDTKDVTIVGGGISGMLSAYALAQQGFQVRLLERDNRLGGTIRTLHTPYGIAESAAHSLLISPPCQDFFKEIELPIAQVNPEARSKFIYRNGRIRKMPLAPLEILGAGARYLFSSRVTYPQTTVADWARKRLGEKALDYLLRPFVTGIYGCAPEELLYEMAFPQEKKTYRGRPKMGVPLLGMGGFVKHLEERLKNLPNVSLQLGHLCTKIPESSNVVLSLHARELSQLFAATNSELSKAFDLVPYTPLVSVTVFMEAAYFPDPPKGVGVLFPPSEKRQILGILFNSSAFPGRVTLPEKHRSFTVMLGGTQNRQILELSDEQIRKLIESEMSLVFGIKARVAHLEIFRYERAIPIYGEALLQAWTQARSTWCSEPGRVIFSSLSGKVSIRGMIETIRVPGKFKALP